jgi:diaminopimelate decarboxylase/aspartate kinase
MIVTKFGGTSVADAEALRRLHAIVAARRVETPLVVVSALAGVSDQLASTCPDAPASDDTVRGVIGGIERRHVELMRETGGAGRVALLDPWLQLLRAGPAGTTPAAASAEWMALGELLASTIVAAALEAWGIPTQWFDVRAVIRTQGADPLQDRPDWEIVQRLADRHLRREIAEERIVVTQGFIGCDAAGRTTLLGRGGSDYSASLLGAALQAERIEIWTDVDGVLTGPPRIVNAARRLRVLSFEEAAELAYFGAKVLHPASLRPARDAGIPVLVANSCRSLDGAATGTLILADTSAYQDERSVVRSVAVKKGVTLVTVHSSRMLMAFGFLARIFSVFAKHATPVDLVSTSEVSVSLTVDDTRALPAIVDELQAAGRVEVASDMAIVCIVGEGMRRARGITARVFRAVGSTEVRMVSQGASEINISLVVHDRDADGVVRRLHDEFFQGNLPQAIFGPAPADLQAAADAAGGRAARHRLAGVAHDLAARHGTPFYVYELDRIERQIARLRGAFHHPRVRIAYACKANFHPDVFRLAQQHGLGIDAVSPMEVERAFECGMPPADILFTANNVATNAMLSLHDRGVRANLGSLSDVRRFAAERADTALFLRLNPGLGEGHHAHVVTGGFDSKFGMLEEEIRTAREILSQRNIRVVGLHAHIGSGIFDPEVLLESTRRLVAAAAGLPDVVQLNVGGGIGIPYRAGDPEFDLEAYAAGLDALLRQAEVDLRRELQLWVEPGRFLVAQAGTLVAKVTCRKETSGHIYIGLDTGMNHLLRPALYGSYHAIRNLSRPDAPVEFVDVVGNICESADIFAFNRPLPSPQEGDLLAIEDVGAYGFAMASHYNLWPLPREWVLRKGQVIES